MRVRTFWWPGRTTGATSPHIRLEFATRQSDDGTVAAAENPLKHLAGLLIVLLLLGPSPCCGSGDESACSLPCCTMDPVNNDDAMTGGTDHAGMNGASCDHHCAGALALVQPTGFSIRIADTYAVPPATELAEPDLSPYLRPPQIRRSA